MNDIVEEFTDYLRMDLHDYLTELRIDPDPVKMFTEDLDEYALAYFVDPQPIESLQQYFQQYVDSLFETQTEQLTNPDRWAELEPERPSPYKRFAQDLWPRRKQTVFFTEDSAGSSRELYNREQGDVTRVLMTSIGYFDLDRTAAVHSAWLKVNPVVVNNRPLLRVGMLLVDLTSGEVECRVFRCGHSWHLAHGDREFAEYQVLQMFEHLGSHDSPQNPWPRFTEPAERHKDSDQLKLARRSLHLSRQKVRGK